LQATWYQFPSVNMQLKMSLSMAQDQTPSGTSAPLSSVRIVAQPTSASFVTHFNYDAQAASQVNVTIVPVPPPKAGDQTSTPPAMTPAAAQTAALASPALFVTTKDANGNKVPATVDSKGNALTLNVSFNAAARVWYVMQYAPSNAAVPPVVAAVDDGTGSVRVIVAS
jgi:hypothetical protein